MSRTQAAARPHEWLLSALYPVAYALFWAVLRPALALLGALGCYGVHAYRARSAATRMPPIDAGMPASFESWLDAGARLARVRYRGASWEARVEGSEALEPGATVFVLATDGNTLKVAKNRPV